MFLIPNCWIADASWDSQVHCIHVSKQEHNLFLCFQACVLEDSTVYDVKLVSPSVVPTFQLILRAKTYLARDTSGSDGRIYKTTGTVWFSPFNEFASLVRLSFLFSLFSCFLLKII